MQALKLMMSMRGGWKKGVLEEKVENLECVNRDVEDILGAIKGLDHRKRTISYNIRNCL